MGAEFVVEPMVRAFTEQIEVEVGEERRRCGHGRLVGIRTGFDDDVLVKSKD
jgi:hypothetical protein